MPRPNKTEENLKTIISFLKESQDIGRPKVSTMKLESQSLDQKTTLFTIITIPNGIEEESCRKKDL